MTEPRFHAIAGLPRAGSTLLCNILAQNPTFCVSGTSPVAAFAEALSATASASEEVRAELIRSGTPERVARTIRGAIRGWYSTGPGVEAVFDKNRYWANQALLFQRLFPDGKIIVVVRDIVQVLASIEKQHRLTAELILPGTTTASTIHERVAQLCDPTGLVGMAVRGLVDMAERRLDGVVAVQYETLAAHPDKAIRALYEALGYEPYAHQYSAVENVSDEVDGLYWHKFPHRGSGTVRPADPHEWKQYLPAEVVNFVRSKFADFCKLYGYQ